MIGTAPIDSERFDWKRAGSLLQAASLMLVRDSDLRAVAALHAEIRRMLGESTVNGQGEIYASRRAAEDSHRMLLNRLSSHAVKFRLPRSMDWRACLVLLHQKLPLWASWVTVLAITAGLTLRYSYGVVQRIRWQRQHPDGNWISRYYDTPGLQDTPLIRYDTAVDYDWGKHAPAETLNRNNWSASWDTCVVVSHDTKLRLTLIADDWAVLSLDGAPRMGLKSPGKRSAKVPLAAGVRHLRIEYRNRRGAAKLHLKGLELAGTDSYRLQRPMLENGEVLCPPPSQPANAGAAGRASAPPTSMK